MRFLRTPKGLMTVVLAVLASAALVGPDGHRILPGLLAGVLAGVMVDLPVLRVREGAWTFPDGALLTGCFVAMVLSPYEPWWVPAATSAFAVLSKYVVRTKSANVFNPAALGLVVSFYAFGTGQSWWGALPFASVWGGLILLASGVFIADRVNKMPMVIVFLGSYFLLFTIQAFVSDPRWVVEIFRQPDLNAVLFFAFFILTDPPTSPVKYRDQIVCALIVAVASVAIFELAAAAHYLLAGALVGNVWEAWRRVSVRKRRRQPTTAGSGAAAAAGG